MHTPCGFPAPSSSYAEVLPCCFPIDPINPLRSHPQSRNPLLHPCPPPTSSLESDLCSAHTKPGREPGARSGGRSGCLEPHHAPSTGRRRRRRTWVFVLSLQFFGRRLAVRPVKPLRKRLDRSRASLFLELPITLLIDCKQPAPFFSLSSPFFTNLNGMYEIVPSLWELSRAQFWFLAKSQKSPSRARVELHD